MIGHVLEDGEANEEIVNLPLCSTSIPAIGASKISFFVLTLPVSPFDLFLLYPSIHSISGRSVYTCLNIIIMPKVRKDIKKVFFLVLNQKQIKTKKKNS